MPKASQREDHELPCHADSVQDFATFKALIETLTHTLSECVKTQSVTSPNKRLIKRVADEILIATQLLESKLEYADCIENPIVDAPINTPLDRTVTIDDVRQTIREEIAKIQIPNVAFTAPSRSFSDIVRTQRQPKSKESAAPPKTKPAIIVSSKKSVLSPAETHKTWKSSVSFRDTSFAPAAVKYVSKNKIRVEFDSIEQRDATLIKANHPDSQVQAEASKCLRPMFIIKGIPADIPAEDLGDIIIGQNEHIRSAVTKKEDLVFRFKRANRNQALYNAVFIATPTVWRAVTDAVKINLDHQRVHTEDYVPLLQCFHCLQFGHTKARCTVGTTICSHCATPGHEFKTCPNKNDPTKAQCQNCVQHAKVTNLKIKTNHSATSHNCPRVTLMTEKIRSRTDYGI